jgi:hypothetical protein
MHIVRELIIELEDMPELLEVNPGTELPANVYRIGLLASLCRVFFPPAVPRLQELAAQKKDA